MHTLDLDAASPHPAPARTASTRAGFFVHHGPWAVGVRLFRNLKFAAKAGLISLAFMVPLVALTVVFLQKDQATIDFARSEIAGVALIAKIEPWLIEAQKQRRLVLSGAASSVDWEAMSKQHAEVHALVERLPGGIDLRQDLLKIEQQQRALKSMTFTNGTGAEEAALQEFVSALLHFRTTALDRSNLTLDPDQDTFYLMSLSTEVVSDVVESISRSRGMAGAAARHGATSPEQLRGLYGVWYVGRSRIEAITAAAARAGETNPDVRRRLQPEAAVSAAHTFYAESERSWFDKEFNADVQGLSKPGQAAVDSLRELAARANQMLGELIQARLDATIAERNFVLVLIGVCLIVAAYLFYAFYLVMNGGLKEVSRHLTAMTDGDLTTSPRPWGRDEAADLMLLLANMQNSLRTMVLKVRAASDGIVDASTEIADGSNDLSARTEQTAANLQQSAAAMEEISATVRQTTDHTQEATRIASHNATVAGRGGEVIQSMVLTMEDIQSASRKIGDIIGVIDGIAFQTNILALNAAVEAARAGEQGRGFAVVASEVRALAQRSAGAAREIKSLISASVEKVENGTGIVREAGSAISDIVKTADHINTLLAQIAVGSDEQNQGIGQVGSAVQELDRATQQNAAMVEQTAAAAASLKDQAVDLAAEVARFKLPQDTRPPRAA
jgi:methyl-accepting chemotaxis protein